VLSLYTAVGEHRDDPRTKIEEEKKNEDWNDNTTHSQIIMIEYIYSQWGGGGDNTFKNSLYLFFIFGGGGGRGQHFNNDGQFLDFPRILSESENMSRANGLGLWGRKEGTLIFQTT
jgi:hypothetical protein